MCLPCGGCDGCPNVKYTIRNSAKEEVGFIYNIFNEFVLECYTKADLFAI